MVVIGLGKNLLLKSVLAHCAAEWSLTYNFETKRFILLFLVDGNMLKKTDQDFLRKSLTSDSFGKLNTEGGMLKGK